MKKIFGLTLVIIIFVALFNISSIRANSPKQIKNLLNFDNLLIYDREPEQDEASTRKFVTKYPIIVDPGESYTLIIGKSFYHPLEWIEDRVEPYYPDGKFFNFERGNKGAGVMLEIPPIKEENYLYFTFAVQSEQLEFVEVAVGNELRKTADIIFYKGTIEDFDSFVSYKSSTTFQKGVYLLDYNNKKTLEDLLTEFTFTDDSNNQVVLDIIQNNYQQNKLGYFDVYFSISDKANNKTFYDLGIRVVDITPPEVGGYNYYEKEVGEIINIEDLKRELEIVDNHTITDDIKITVEEDNYTLNYNKVGEHDVVFKVADESNNYTLFTVKINVIDSKPPTIEGPAEIFRYVGDSKLTIIDLQGIYSAFDEVDGNLTQYISINNDYNENIAGNYERLLSVSDLSGNTVTKLIYINVVDGIPPTIETTNLILSFYEYNQMDLADIIEYLQSFHSDASDIMIVYNETEYLDDFTEIVYVYYSYTLNNKTFYGRIAIEPNLTTAKNNTIIYTLLLSFNLLFVVLYTVRSKKLVGYFK